MKISRINETMLKIDEHIWHEIRVRKAHHCSDCNCFVPKGRKMYRAPVAAAFRDERLCLDCIKRLETPVSLNTPIDQL